MRRITSAISVAGALALVLSMSLTSIGAQEGRPPLDRLESRDDFAAAVVNSEGATIGPVPDPPRSALKRSDGIKVRLTLDEAPLTAGESTWITTKVKNASDAPIELLRDGCEISVDVQAEMVDQQWRPGLPVDLEAIEAAGRQPELDLKWRAANWWAVGETAIGLDFVPRAAVGIEDYGCDSVGITRRLEPGGVIQQRMRWDGQAAGSLGPPPDGAARITGSFAYGPHGSPGANTIVAELEVPVVSGRDAESLHPMEAVDAALADAAFRALIEQVRVGARNNEVVYYDGDRGIWFIGVCGRFEGTHGYWKAAIVDPVSGEVLETLDGPSGKGCRAGPWVS